MNYRCGTNRQHNETIKHTAKLYHGYNFVDHKFHIIEIKDVLYFYTTGFCRCDDPQDKYIWLDPKWVDEKIETGELYVLGHNTYNQQLIQGYYLVDLRTLPLWLRFVMAFAGYKIPKKVKAEGELFDFKL